MSEVIPKSVRRVPRVRPPEAPEGNVVAATVVHPPHESDDWATVDVSLNNESGSAELKRLLAALHFLINSKNVLAQASNERKALFKLVFLTFQRRIQPDQ